MQENLHNSAAMPTTTSGSSWLSRMLSSVILDRMGSIQGGWVRLNWQGKQYLLGETGHPSTPIDMHIHNDQFFTTLATRGSIGAAESYMDGHWTTNDLEGALLQAVICGVP